MPVQNLVVTVPVAKKYPPLPKEVYQCQLLDIENKMEPKWGAPDESEMKIIFTFVVIEDGEFYGRRVYERATTKLSKYKGGSNLYKILVGLRGGELTDAQCADPQSVASDPELNKLIGTQVRLSVGLKEKEKKPGEFKNVVDSYLPVKNKLPEFDADKVVKADDSEPTAEAPIPALTFDE